VCFEKPPGRTASQVGTIARLFETQANKKTVLYAKDINGDAFSK
jgi:trans-2-enoyl-CoA reductase